MAPSSGRDILKYPHIGGKLFQAYAAATFFFQGKLPYRDSIKPILNGGFKTKEQRAKFRHLFFEFVNKKYGSFDLYGKPFYPASENYVEAIAWIDEVIIKDQYKTGLIKDGDFIIDAGANIGVFSVTVAHSNPNAHIYSFEPTPKTFEALSKNTESYSNITVMNLGLGNEIADKQLLVYDNFSGSNSIGHVSEMFGEPDRIESIKITTIDEFAKDLPRVDFIKMDTEGYEANILKGAAETIKKWKPVIAMSAYHKPNDKEELPALLRSFDPSYVFDLRHDAEEDLICYVPDRNIAEISSPKLAPQAVLHS